MNFFLDNQSKGIKDHEHWIRNLHQLDSVFYWLIDNVYVSKRWEFELAIELYGVAQYLILFESQAV